MKFAGNLLMISGASLCLLAGIGVLRFTDTYSRMHAAAKASSLGLIFVALGAALHLGEARAAVLVGLVIVLQLLTAPVSTHLLGSGLHRQIGAVSDLDELSDDELSDVEQVVGNLVVDDLAAQDFTAEELSTPHGQSDGD